MKLLGMKLHVKKLLLWLGILIVAVSHLLILSKTMPMNNDMLQTHAYVNLLAVVMIVYGCSKRKM